MRAPLANACVILTGSACPSFGSHKPPTTSLTFNVGYFSAISSGLISSISTPKARAMPADLFSSSIRSLVNATVIDPLRLKPVERPVSFSSF